MTYSGATSIDGASAGAGALTNIDVMFSFSDDYQSSVDSNSQTAYLTGRYASGTLVTPGSKISGSKSRPLALSSGIKSKIVFVCRYVINSNATALPTAGNCTATAIGKLDGSVPR